MREYEPSRVPVQGGELGKKKLAGGIIIITAGEVWEIVLQGFAREFVSERVHVTHDQDLHATVRDKKTIAVNTNAQKLYPSVHSRDQVIPTRRWRLMIILK
jgi:hypothetical protein